MKFEFIGNACGIFHGHKGTTLLCDPWIVNGVFDGSWCHYPPLETKIEDLLNVDILYISHIHQDHYDDRHFNFRKDIPIIVLDHKHNFLIKNLERSGFTNLILIKDNETKAFEEFEITLYAPFIDHNFHETNVGNLIDSAMVIKNEKMTAINFNDNTPSIQSCSALREKFGSIDLALINYNAAGPYPSSFKNLSEIQKVESHNKTLIRNYEHMISVIDKLKPSYVLPFAGSYIIGGKHSYKNKYLGTSTWDACREYVSDKVNESSQIICLREKNVFNLINGKSDVEYVPIDKDRMKRYIDEEMPNLKYPYEEDAEPNFEALLKDIQIATFLMQERMERIGIVHNTEIYLILNEKEILLYSPPNTQQKLVCEIDTKLLRRILDHKSHWNNAEIGCHIDFYRSPDFYEPDAHTSLQFLHL
jgi:UDP-MurNAc hydroxylase